MKILFIGDSITEGAGASKPELMYTNRVAKNLNAEVLNYGIGGTRYARQNDLWANNVIFNFDFNMRLEITPKDVDFVVCFGGVNDFGHGSAPIGKKNDKSLYTFYGATKAFFKNVVKKYGNKKILVVLPLPCFAQNSGKGEFGVAKADGSPNLSTYKNIIREIAEHNKLTVVDYESSFYEPLTRENSELFYDGLHPNDQGHELLANLISDDIRKLLVR